MATHQKVQVWIHRKAPNSQERQFLLLKTHSGRGGFWQPVTGGVEVGESLAQAALREASEETGLPFSTPVVPIPHSFTFEKRGRKIEEAGFSIEVDLNKGSESEPMVRIDPHEHSEYRWATAEQAFQ
jgi:8-oxo-dGTP pyrophosphatase MutT (NUDIX family)